MNDTKEKLVSGTLLKLNTSTNHLKGNERQATDWQKICKQIFDKGLASKIYFKTAKKLNSKKELNLKKGKLPNETLHQGRHKWQICIGKDASHHIL